MFVIHINEAGGRVIGEEHGLLCLHVVGGRCYSLVQGEYVITITLIYLFGRLIGTEGY